MDEQFETGNQPAEQQRASATPQVPSPAQEYVQEADYAPVAEYPQEADYAQPAEYPQAGDYVQAAEYPDAQGHAPAHQRAARPGIYVRQRPAHRSVGTVSDFDGAEDQPPANTVSDSGYTNRGPLMGGASYRRTRAGAKKMQRNNQYGQYLEVPKGRRDIFVKRERRSNAKTALVLILVCAVLAIVVYFVWQFMQTSWGAAAI